MIADNFESITVIEISSESDEILETSLAGENAQVKQEIEALIKAIKNRAEAESRDFSTEAYLNIVRRARKAVESQPISQGNRQEQAWLILQEEAERSWYLLMKAAIDFGHRWQNATQSAWSAFSKIN